MATQEYTFCSVEDSNRKGDACLAVAFVKSDSNVEFFPEVPTDPVNLKM